MLHLSKICNYFNSSVTSQNLLCEVEPISDQTEVQMMAFEYLFPLGEGLCFACMSSLVMSLSVCFTSVSALRYAIQLCR